MNAFGHGFRNAERQISSLAPRISITNREHSWLVGEELAHPVRTEVPQLSEFNHGIVTFSVRSGPCL